MTDPVLITRLLRAKASSHLLVVAIHHLNIFELLGRQSLTLQELRDRLALKDRPAMVLFPALCAMGMVQVDEQNKYSLTDAGAFLSLSHPYQLTGYTSLEKDDPGVLHLLNWLKNDGPATPAEGLSYVKDADAASPMDEPEAARFFTMALAGRAKLLSPLVAKKITHSTGHLLDVAGGTGFYAYEWLLENSEATATLFDRPEVLTIAMEMLEAFIENTKDQSLRHRIHFVPGDMLEDELPHCDILLAASLFHDWPDNTCRLLAKKFARALIPNGELWAHDAFLHDGLDGPIAVTDYSTMLFLGTKGRCYSRKEYRQWFEEAGLTPQPDYHPTMLDYGLISAVKP